VDFPGGCIAEYGKADPATPLDSNVRMRWMRTNARPTDAHGFAEVVNEASRRQNQASKTYLANAYSELALPLVKWISSRPIPEQISQVWPSPAQCGWKPRQLPDEI